MSIGDAIGSIARRVGWPRYSLRRRVFLLALALAVLTTGLSYAQAEARCVTDDCRYTVTRRGWPMSFTQEYSSKQDELFRGFHPRWYRNTTLLGISLIPASVDVVFWLAVYLAPLSLLAWIRLRFAPAAPGPGRQG